MWDWKALKFKSKHYHHASETAHYVDDEFETGTDAGEDGYTGYEPAPSDHRRRRRREQQRPAAPAARSAADSHRFVTEDGRLLEPSQVPGELYGATVTSETATGAPEAATVTSKEPADPLGAVTDLPESAEAATAVEDEGVTVGSIETGGDSVTENTPQSSVGETEADEQASDDHHDAAENDDGEVEEPRHEEEIIVHSFGGGNGDRVLLGAGTAGSLAPEYDPAEVEDVAKLDGDNAGAAYDLDKKHSGDTATRTSLASLLEKQPEHPLATSDSGNRDVNGSKHHGAKDGDDDGGDDRNLGDDDHDDDEDRDGDDEAGGNDSSGALGAKSSGDHYPGAGAGVIVSDHGDKERNNHHGGRGADHGKGKKKTSKDKEKDKTHGYYGHSKPLQRTTPCEHGIHYLADVGTTLITDVSTE